ncbi:MAG: hypothetical protein EZS28_025404 [Streblomastix strix]|uniref:RING-type domain-containing protein n=1 Tax=Streblomastix strix TaxID=222440 RepID=A0A5J4V977_9EUKA|nr:MAG: hypothetical protein EZS28_025404 [Streblomastix strix]
MTLTKARREDFCSICQSSDNSYFVTLPCHHSFHHICPNCNKLFNLRDFGCESSVWTIRNIGVSCVPTDEGRMIKATGWYNIQLQIIPPPRVVVEKVKYVFHPAFNISKLTLIQEPFDLLVKLCSSNVHVLIEITFHKKDNWPKSIFKKKE